MFGPYLKIQEYQGHQNVLITEETLCTTNIYEHKFYFKAIW